jgi:hypothetical protein
MRSMGAREYIAHGLASPDCLEGSRHRYAVMMRQPGEASVAEDRGRVVSRRHS